MRFIIFFSIGILLSSCGEKIELTETEDTGTIKNIDQELECECSELGLNSDSLFIYQDSLFTGTCYSNYPESNDRYVQKHYLQGQLHGKILFFDKEGSVIAEEEYSNGENTVSATEGYAPCDCTELTIEQGVNGMPNRKYKNTKPFNGTCHQYYPGTDVLYMELSYQNGILHGYCKYYDKEGNQLYMEEYNKGVLEAVIN